MVGSHHEPDDGLMNRAPSFIASICFIAAALAIGPFGQAGGSETNDTQPVGCGAALVAAPSTTVAVPCRP